jgi:A nuclease family of the HNH/ENDO VII superfamily with conserved AHH
VGIGQWTRLSITSGSIFCKQYNIKPGEYLIMYDTSISKLLIQDQKQGKIVYEKYASSLLDLISVLSSSVPDTTDLEVIQRLKRGGKSRGDSSEQDHHIIPVHLWKDCQLIVEAERHGVIDMNGPDNMMLLPNDFHKKNHDKNSKYSQIVRSHLRDRWNALIEADLENDPHEIRDVLISLIGALEANLTDLCKEGGYMNDI